MARLAPAFVLERSALSMASIASCNMNSWSCDIAAANSAASATPFRLFRNLGQTTVSHQASFQNRGLSETIMNHKVYVLLVIVVACSACAVETPLKKPGTTQADFERDKLRCMGAMYAERERGAPNWHLYDYCMESRGHSRTPVP